MGFFFFLFCPKIRKMGVSAPVAALAPANKKTPKATSLAQMLLQALRTSDNSLLEEVGFLVRALCSAFNV